MKKVLIIGSGISGLTSAIEIAAGGGKAVLVSPYPSERAQSVMAAGGVNASREDGEDSLESHIADTLKGGRYLAGEKTVGGLCREAPDILRFLESIGVVFNRDEKGEIDRRAFGGQSHRRTAFAGASTGKQIVTALVQKAREYEKSGLIERRLGYVFHSGLIDQNRCYGALFYAEREGRLTPFFADETIMAVGGQNLMFGKTTGSVLCDGYAAGRLFLQGAVLKNLEFIQYHPTAIETPQKRMLITEAARGEGGRLYYEEDGRRVYFMEERFGPSGNLMPRDVVSKCMADTGRQVWLDVTFLGKKRISERLREVDELCRRYLSLDISAESIPVAPTVHFFMGGFAVDSDHRTSIRGLYAVGECASIYHGANRLGGNSLLAAVYGGRKAARDILSREEREEEAPDFTEYIENCASEVARHTESGSKFPAVYLLKPLENVMNTDMGITRTGERLREGIRSMDYYLEAADKLRFDADFSPYHVYRVKAMLTLARAILTSAETRRETRGAHIREDYPESDRAFEACSLIRYNGGRYDVSYEREDDLCW